MTLAPETRLGSYEIVVLLGSGGMGQVYRARDTKLGREVALKVLPPELAASEERRHRFEREARAIAALNHPNIVHVYSVEHADNVHFITMELVRGKTLTALLPKNGFALGKFFEIAIPLTDAVAAAHQEGITHRDLKPDNVMVTEEGRVKVLDFGVAKLRAPFADSAASELPTQSATREGSIIGTVAYMSPEQAEGKPLDHRSDIFSLGIVLYEMLAGERPFKGDSPTSTLSSIIKDSPAPLREQKPTLPRDLAKIVNRCLAKDPIRRFQSAIDLRNELEETKRDVDSGEAFEGTTLPRHSKSVWLLGGLVTVAAVFAALILTHPSDAPVPSDVPELANPIQLTSAIGVEDFPTWSPDGKTIAYAASGAESGEAANWDIWVTQLGGGQPVNRTADHAGIDSFPSWSPDGTQIAFWSDREGGGYFVMSALGGSARMLIFTGTERSSYDAYGPPQWSMNGEELAAVVHEPPEIFVEIVSLKTRESRRLSLPGRRLNRTDLSWSPDGRFFAYFDGHREMEITQLWLFRVSEEKGIELTDGRSKVWSPMWSEDGAQLHFISNQGGNMDLWRQSIGPDGELLGHPRPVSAGIGMRHALFSTDGTKLAYSQGRRVANVFRVPLLEDRPATWADAEQVTFDHALAESLDLSPDGDRLVISSERSGNLDLWVVPVEGGKMVAVTTDPTPDWHPRWSPDGTEVAFHSYRSGNREIWVMPVSGGPARQLTDGQASGTESYTPAWSPDGREIAFTSGRDRKAGIYVVPSEGGDAIRLSIEPDFNWHVRWSPDGEWLAFDSAGSLWRVRRTGGKAELLTRGAEFPLWSRDGRRIFYVGEDEKAGNVWILSLEDGSERRLTDLVGRRGRLQAQGLATDGPYLYFMWDEDVGDLWVMDVVQER